MQLLADGAPSSTLIASIVDSTFIDVYYGLALRKLLSKDDSSQLPLLLGGDGIAAAIIRVTERS